MTFATFLALASVYIVVGTVAILIVMHDPKD